MVDVRYSIRKCTGWTRSNYNQLRVHSSASTGPREVRSVAMESADSKPSVSINKNLRNESVLPEAQTWTRVLVGNLLGQAMSFECLCCQNWLSRELPPSLQLETAVQTALCMHPDTEYQLVLVEATGRGRIVQKAKSKKIFKPPKTVLKFKSGWISLCLWRFSISSFHCHQTRLSRSCRSQGMDVQPMVVTYGPPSMMKTVWPQFPLSKYYSWVSREQLDSGMQIWEERRQISVFVEGILLAPGNRRVDSNRGASVEGSSFNQTHLCWELEKFLPLLSSLSPSWEQD